MPVKHSPYQAEPWHRQSPQKSLNKKIALNLSQKKPTLGLRGWGGLVARIWPRERLENYWEMDIRVLMVIWAVGVGVWDWEKEGDVVWGG